MGTKDTALTPVSEFTADLYPPEAGTNVNAADVEIGEQVLLNRTEILKDWVEGTVLLPGVDPTPTEDPGLQRFHALGLARAWANVSTNGSGSVAANDAYNCGTPTITTTRIKVPLIRAFANVNYAVYPEVDATAARRTINVASRTTTEVQLVVFNDAGTVIDPTAVALTVSFSAHGRQV